MAVEDCIFSRLLKESYLLGRFLKTKLLWKCAGETAHKETVDGN
jgi:hypothetical protein